MDHLFFLIWFFKSDTIAKILWFMQNKSFFSLFKLSSFFAFSLWEGCRWHSYGGFKIRYHQFFVVLRNGQTNIYLNLVFRFIICVIKAGCFKFYCMHIISFKDQFNPSQLPRPPSTSYLNLFLPQKFVQPLSSVDKPLQNAGCHQRDTSIEL